MKPIINIKLGSKPIYDSVIERAKEAHMNAQGWTSAMRDDAMNEGAFLLAGYIQEAPAFDRAMVSLSQFERDLTHTIQINTFNTQLEAYRKATARLTRYPLADGRPEIWEEQETGEYLDGEPVFESVLIQTGIEPLPETVEITEYDAEGEETVNVVPNPLIVADDAEREAAQAVIDATPQEVKDWP